MIESETMAKVSFDCRYAFVCLTLTVDDFGRYEANPKILRARLFPLDLNKVSEADVSRWITLWVDSGLVSVYAVTGKRYLQVNKWEQGRAKVSKYPEPPTQDSAPQQMQTSVNICKHMSTHVPDPDPDPDYDPDPDPGLKPPNPLCKGEVALQLPFDSKEFGNCWREWEKHRTEIRKPLKPTSVTQQFAMLKGLGEAFAIETIRHTIAMGWQGLRQPNQEKNNGNSTRGSFKGSVDDGTRAPRI